MRNSLKRFNLKLKNIPLAPGWENISSGSGDEFTDLFFNKKLRQFSFSAVIQEKDLLDVYDIFQNEFGPLEKMNLGYLGDVKEVEVIGNEVLNRNLDWRMKLDSDIFMKSLSIHLDGKKLNKLYLHRGEDHFDNLIAKRRLKEGQGFLLSDPNTSQKKKKEHKLYKKELSSDSQEELGLNRNCKLSDMKTDDTYHKQSESGLIDFKPDKKRLYEIEDNKNIEISSKNSNYSDCNQTFRTQTIINNNTFGDTFKSSLDEVLTRNIVVYFNEKFVEIMKNEKSWKNLDKVVDSFKLEKITIDSFLEDTLRLFYLGRQYQIKTNIEGKDTPFVISYLLIDEEVALFCNTSKKLSKEKLVQNALKTFYPKIFSEFFRATFYNEEEKLRSCVDSLPEASKCSNKINKPSKINILDNQIPRSYQLLPLYDTQKQDDSIVKIATIEAEKVTAIETEKVTVIEANKFTAIEAEKNEAEKVTAIDVEKFSAIETKIVTAIEAEKITTIEPQKVTPALEEHKSMDMEEESLEENLRKAKPNTSHTPAEVLKNKNERSNNIEEKATNQDSINKTFDQIGSNFDEFLFHDNDNFDGSGYSHHDLFNQIQDIYGDYSYYQLYENPPRDVYNIDASFRNDNTPGRNENNNYAKGSDNIQGTKEDVYNPESPHYTFEPQSPSDNINQISIPTFNCSNDSKRPFALPPVEVPKQSLNKEINKEKAASDTAVDMQANRGQGEFSPSFAGTRKDLHINSGGKIREEKSKASSENPIIIDCEEKRTTTMNEKKNSNNTINNVTRKDGGFNKNGKVAEKVNIPQAQAQSRIENSVGERQQRKKEETEGRLNNQFKGEQSGNNQKHLQTSGQKITGDTPSNVRNAKSNEQELSNKKTAVEKEKAHQYGDNPEIIKKIEKLEGFFKRRKYHFVAEELYQETSSDLKISLEIVKSMIDLYHYIENRSPTIFKSMDDRCYTFALRLNINDRVENIIGKHGDRDWAELRFYSKYLQEIFGNHSNNLNEAFTKLKSSIEKMHSKVAPKEPCQKLQEMLDDLENIPIKNSSVTPTTTKKQDYNIQAIDLDSNMESITEQNKKSKFMNDESFNSNKIREKKNKLVKLSLFSREKEKPSPEKNDQYFKKSKEKDYINQRNDQNSRKYPFRNEIQSSQSCKKIFQRDEGLKRGREERDEPKVNRNNIFNRGTDLPFNTNLQRLEKIDQGKGEYRFKKLKTDQFICID